MRKHQLIVGLLLMMAAGAGCVVIDVEKVQSCRPAAVEPAEATIREIVVWDRTIRTGCGREIASCRPNARLSRLADNQGR